MWRSWVTNAKCLHLKSLLIIPLAMPEVQGQTAKSSFFRENKIFHTKIIKWQAQMQPTTQVILFFSNTVMILVLCLIYLHFVLLCWWPSRNKYKRLRTDIFLVSVPQVKIFFLLFQMWTSSKRVFLAYMFELVRLTSLWNALLCQIDTTWLFLLLENNDVSLKTCTLRRTQE